MKKIGQPTTPDPTIASGETGAVSQVTSDPTSGTDETPSAPAPEAPLASGYRSGADLPDQTGAAGAGLRHQLALQVGTTPEALARDGVAAVVPGATRRTGWTKALDRLARMTPESAGQAQGRLHDLAAAAAAPEAIFTTLLQPALDRAARYAEPSAAAANRPLAALGRKLTAGTDDGRYLGAARGAAALLTGLAEAGWPPAEVIEHGSQLLRTLDRGDLAHPETEADAAPLRTHVRALVTEAWQAATEAVFAEVQAEVGDSPVRSVRHIEAPRLALEERLRTLSIGGQRFTDAPDAARRRRALLDRVDTTPRAIALARTDYVDQAGARALRRLAARLTKGAPTEAMVAARHRVAGARFAGLTLPKTDGPDLANLCDYATELVEIRENLPRQTRRQVAERLETAAARALDLGAKEDLPFESALARFENLGALAGTLPPESPTRARLVALQADGAHALLTARLADVKQKGASRGVEFEGLRREADAFLGALEPGLTPEAHAALSARVETAFSEWKGRIADAQAKQRRSRWGLSGGRNPNLRTPTGRVTPLIR